MKSYNYDSLALIQLQWEDFELSRWRNPTTLQNWFAKFYGERMENKKKPLIGKTIYDFIGIVDWGVGGV